MDENVSKSSEGLSAFLGDIKMSRRSFLKLSGGGLLTGGSLAVSPSILSFQSGVFQKARFLWNIEWSNTVYWSNMIDTLWGATDTDWGYRPERSFLLIDQVLSATSSLESRVGQFIQRVCPDEYLVSSPVDDSKFGLTPQGRVSMMNDGLTHQIPYFVEDLDLPLKGSIPREGGSAAVIEDGNLKWLFEEFELISSKVKDYGVIELVLEDGEGLKVTQTCYMPFGSETLVMDFELENRSDSRRDLDFGFHLQANANSKRQNPVAFHTSYNKAAADNKVKWKDQNSENTITMALEDEEGQKAEFTGAARAPIGGDDREKVDEHIREVTKNRPYLKHYFEQGIKEEDRELSKGVELENIFSEKREGAKGRYISGYAKIETQLKPGETTTRTVKIRKGGLKETGSEAETRKAWRDWIEEAEIPEVGEKLEEQAEHSLARIFKNWVPSRNAMIAAPHIQPMYYFVWPRDAIVAAEGAALMGRPEIAEKTLTEYLPSVMEDDGSFKQCYMTDGREANLIREEYDQSAKFIRAAFRIDSLIDTDITGEIEEELVEASRYLAANIGFEDLLKPCYDYKENPWDITSSLYANSLALDALQKADQEFNTDFSRQIETLKNGIDQKFLSPSLYRVLKFTGLEKDFNGMSSYAFETPAVSSKSYFEEILEDVGLEQVEDRWTVALNRTAKAAASFGDEKLTVNGQTITGKAAARKRLEAVIDRASAHGTIYEKVKDGDFTDATHLSMSDGEFLIALNGLSKNT